MWRIWIRFCLKFNRSMERFFEVWTRFLCRNTVSVITITLLIGFGLLAGFMHFEKRSQAIRLYYPQYSPAWEELEKTEKYFNNYVISTNFMLTVTSKDGDKTSPSYSNAVRDDLFRYALQVHKEIINVSTVYDGKKLTFKNLCIMSNNRCIYANALEVFDYNISKIKDVGTVLKAAYLNTTRMLQGGRNLQFMMPELFGRYNVSGDKITATAVRFVYRTHFGKTLKLYNRNKAIGKLLQDIFHKHVNIAKTKGFQIVYDTESSVDDSVDENSGGNIVLVVTAIILMLTLCSLLTIGFRDPIAGHFLMSIAGICSVIIGTAGGFGIVMLSGQPYVAFAGVLPFLVLAVGVDNMFIVMDEVDKVDPSITGPERLVTAIKHVGATITMTSMTNIVAFFVTASSDLPAVRLFCIYAAVSITFTYLMMLSFFLCLFVYDIKRIENGRRDFIACLADTKRMINPWGKRYVTFSEKVCKQTI